MRIIFDENVPWPLRRFFHDHTVSSVQLEGWTGVENGELLQRAEGHFDVLLLADKNLRYQQNLTERQIALVELPSNRWPILQAIVPRILAAVENAKPASYSIVEQ